MNHKGFASSEAQREAAAKGGRRAHELGVAHEFKKGSELAREAGRKGGAVHKAKRDAIRAARLQEAVQDAGAPYVIPSEDPPKLNYRDGESDVG